MTENNLKKYIYGVLIIFISMVDVVTSKEFAEFRKDIEKQLEMIEAKIDDLIKDLEKRDARIEANIDDLRRRVDELSESSKGFIQRLRAALFPQAPPQPNAELKEEGGTEKTIGKVAEIVMKCPNFFDWDLCQESCPLYRFCDQIAAVHDVSKLSRSNLTERVRKSIMKFLTKKDSRS